MEIGVTISKKSTSSFLKIYQTEMIEWADYVNNNAQNILAISRKGPRLIEMLHNAGLISDQVYHNTFSEYALPFLGKMDDLSIIDDSVLYGSTLSKTLILAEKYLNIISEKIDVIPVIYSTDTPNEVKKKINQKVSTSIEAHRTTHYVGSLITSFKLLGKPYDIEHPIAYIQGDFRDIELLKIRIEHITQSISEFPLIVNDNNNSYPPSFTILLNGGEDGTNDFSKFRIYLNDSYTRLAIVPISPIIISDDEIEKLSNAISPEFANIWGKVYQTANTKAGKECLWKRSLVVFANYLNSLALLLDCMPQLGKHFNKEEMYFDVYDLQILLGTKIATVIATELNKLIVRDFASNPIKIISNFDGEIKNSIFPFNENEYNEFLNNRLETLKSLNEEFEIINMIFVAQHYKIEVPSRKESQFNDVDRLKFGVSLQYIIEKVKKIKPEYSIVKIHSALDKLIDSGTIVPKYSNVATKENQVIWKRAFRVGEGSPSTIQRILTMEPLLRGFPKEYLQNGIPAVVLEKCFVIAFTFPFTELKEGVADLGITKGFDLYGARSYFKNSDGSEHSLLEWLTAQDVLKRQPNDSYKINDTIFDNKNYWEDANKELSLTYSAQDKLEDIANFCYVVSRQINENALVSITSLSNEREYWKAISAELSLWLNHPRYSIYNCIHKLDELSVSAMPDSFLMTSCNKLLEKNANFTAQVKNKKELFEKFNKDIIKIDEIIEASNNKSINRVWRNVKESINQRKNKESNASFNNDVLSVLRIAHTITSTCRTLLNKAGYKYAGTGEPKSIKIYLEERLLKIITESPNLVKNHFQDRNIIKDLRKAIDEFDETDNFYQTYQKLRGLLGKMIVVCDNLYEKVATEPKQYSHRTLNPPVYVVMWDMRNSTSVENRSDIEQNVIFPINEKIKSLLKNNPFQTFEESSDDGNCFLTANFNDVVSAFTIISGIAKDNDVTFRMGCDVNYEGELRVYPSLKKNLFAGRVFEYAARTTSLYKEVKNDSKSWIGNSFIYKEPATSYLLVSEFAKRKAVSDGQWDFSNINIQEFDGEYLPRVKQGTSIPYKIFQLTYLSV